MFIKITSYRDVTFIELTLRQVKFIQKGSHHVKFLTKRHFM